MENHEDQTVQELDALIVGAGFGGVYQLWRLRNESYNVKLVDSASDYGGVWYWNRYPGARVDSTIPHYEFSVPNLWQSWTWTQRFPSSAELRAYFKHVANKWDLRRDTIFNSYVESAVWKDDVSRWLISTRDGRQFKVQYFLLNTGFAAKRHMPNWPGIDKFKNTWIHPSYWPKEEPDLRGKNIAVVGTGATGVQLSQEMAKVANKFVLFQRTPNLAIPMKQVEYGGDEQIFPKADYTKFFSGRNDHFSGFNFEFLPKKTFDDTPEARKQRYEQLWTEGDFHFWLGTYIDMLFDEEANKEAYNFWRDKVRARLKDERLKEILAPEKQPHAFGCKRISLENGYYEIFNQENVELVDVNATPVLEVTERGIRTSEKEYEFDYVICATGFDAITGGMLMIDIRGKDGLALREKWKKGTKTYLGMSVQGFPNMFFTYGPQAPTAFCNGPTCAELQGEWIVNMMNTLRRDGKGRIDADKEAEAKWAEDVWTFAKMSLLPGTKSWYMGDNIPGKVREPLIYLGGVPKYHKTIEECATQGYKGFVVG